MGTTPEGSRDLSRKSDDAPSRPLTAVRPETPETADGRPITQPGDPRHASDAEATDAELMDADDPMDGVDADDRDDRDDPEHAVDEVDTLRPGTQPGTEPAYGPTGTVAGDILLPEIASQIASYLASQIASQSASPIASESGSQLEPPARTGMTLPGDPSAPGGLSISDLLPPPAADVAHPDPLASTVPAVPGPPVGVPMVPPAPRLGATRLPPTPRLGAPVIRPLPRIGPRIGPSAGTSPAGIPSPVLPPGSPLVATPGPAALLPPGTQPGTVPAPHARRGGTQPGTVPAPTTSTQPGVVTPAPSTGTQPGTVPAPTTTQHGDALRPLGEGRTNTMAVMPSSRDPQSLGPDSLNWTGVSGLMDSAELDDADIDLGDPGDPDIGDPDVNISEADDDQADERDDEDREGEPDERADWGYDRGRSMPAARDVLVHQPPEEDEEFSTSRFADPSEGSDDGTRVEPSPSADGEIEIQLDASPSESGTISHSGLVPESIGGAQAGTSNSGARAGPISHSGGSGSLAPRRDALFGQVLADRYRVLDLIGKGGMGKVYLAEHVALGKRVAVKVLNPAYTHRPDQVKRFLREAQAASKIGHENVIDVIDFGEMPNGSVFFAMEHLQGEDLGKLLRRSGALPWSRARRILLQICRALQAAHAKGILHRDMKPENIFIIHRNGMRDFVKVLDFGIAKVLEENRQVSHTLTQAGALIGTPEYMAPEQVQGEVGDVRMDIYALGCIMYQLLTGQLPFSDKTMFGVLSQQVNVRPVPPRQLMPSADIPPEVETIILKAMEKERAMRFQTMAELIEGIVAAPRGTPDGRAGTTSNLDAAASAARIAAAMNAASMQALAGSNASGTPPEVSFNNMSLPNASLGSGMGSGSGSGSAAVSPTNVSAGQWPGVARDPQLLTKLVIGLCAAVFMLLIGLVCALNRGGDEAVTTSVAAVTPPSDEPPSDEPPVETPVKAIETPVLNPDVPVTVPVPVPPPDPVVPTPRDDGGDIVVDDDPAVPKKVTPVTKKNPVSKVPKADPGPAPTLERLEPFDQKRALAGVTKDVESCRAASSAPRGSVAIVKIKVDGATGRVLESTPADTTPAARCIAKIVKSKVKFPRFKKSPQEFNFRFQM